MNLRKLWMTAILGGTPAIVAAQPRVDVRVEVGDSYDTVVPGDPVESVDVFYDQLSPYGVWVDEPDVGRVFVPDDSSFVPYTVGYWIYTNVGFVWVSNEPFAWATTHYGRWAYSSSYGRWYWLPDMQWGPAWVQWRQTGAEFGWAPMAPDIVIRMGWQPPIESWHYCPAERVLDVNLTRYYVPRERVAVIQRQAKPIEHYSTIGHVTVVVGPPAATLREHHVAATRVKVEPRAVGRWTPTEAHTQATHARERKVVFETQNQQRIQSNEKIHEAHTKVVETHPQIKAQVNARISVKPEPAHVDTKRPEPPHVDTKRPEPPRVDTKRPTPAPTPHPAEHVAPKSPVEHAPVKPPAPPEHVAPKAPVEHAPVKPPTPPEHVAPKAPVEHAPVKPPTPPEHVAPKAPVEHAPAPKPEPANPARKPQPAHPAPAPVEHKDEHKDEHH